VIVRAVGLRAELEVEHRAVAMEDGDLYLLCSDGLTDMVTDEQIARVLEREPRSGAACAELIDIAKLAGGRDNITMVIVDFDE